MEFSEWLKQTREAREFSLRDLGKLAAVDSSTLSRIETAKSKPLFRTVVQLVEALSVTPGDLVVALTGRRYDALDDLVSRRYSPRVVLRSDIDQFLSFFFQDIDAGRRLLAWQCNEIVARLDDFVWRERYQGRIVRSYFADITFGPSDIDKFLSESKAFTFKLTYPEDLLREIILQIWRDGGIISLEDVGAVVRQGRKAMVAGSPSLTTSSRSLNMSAPQLSLIEHGAIEGLKFEDVVGLDSYLRMNGELLALCWTSCEYSTMIHDLRAHRPREDEPTRWNSQKATLVILFIRACRWLQYLEPTDLSWLFSIRDTISRSSASGAGAAYAAHQQVTDEASA